MSAWTYVINPAHDLHLHINLLIEYTILDKTPLLEFLGSIRLTIHLVGDHIDYCKSASTDSTDLIVFVTTAPLLAAT